MSDRVFTTVVMLCSLFGIFFSVLLMARNGLIGLSVFVTFILQWADCCDEFTTKE